MNPRQNEELRHIVLEVLANRHPLAFEPHSIRRRAEPELDFKITDDDVTVTLEFLRGLGLVKFETDGLGSSKHWQATSNGVLANERGKIPAQPHTTE